MKRSFTISVAAIICLLFAGISVYSAEEKSGVFIYEYKKELGLADKQEKNLRDILANFQSYVADKHKALNGLRTELNKMVTESADLDKIKAKLNDIAGIQAEIAYQSIVSNRAIEAELTGIQLSRWRSIQAEFAKNFQQALDVASQTKEIKK